MELVMKMIVVKYDDDGFDYEGHFHDLC